MGDHADEGGDDDGESDDDGNDEVAMSADDNEWRRWCGRICRC